MIFRYIQSDTHKPKMQIYFWIIWFTEKKPELVLCTRICFVAAPYCCLTAALLFRFGAHVLFYLCVVGKFSCHSHHNKSHFYWTIYWQLLIESNQNLWWSPSMRDLYICEHFHTQYATKSANRNLCVIYGHQCCQQALSALFNCLLWFCLTFRSDIVYVYHFPRFCLSNVNQAHAHVLVRQLYVKLCFLYSFCVLFASDASSNVRGKCFFWTDWVFIYLHNFMFRQDDIFEKWNKKWTIYFSLEFFWNNSVIPVPQPT